MSADEIKDQLRVLNYAHCFYEDQVNREKVNLTVEKILNAVVAGRIPNQKEKFETDWAVDESKEAEESDQ